MMWVSLQTWAIALAIMGSIVRVVYGVDLVTPALEYLSMYL